MSDAHGLFWNSESGDRVYDAESFAEWLKPFFNNGVFFESFAPESANAMTVTLSSGTGFINGKLRTVDTQTILTFDTANAVYPRIDNIVLEADSANREITLKVVKGSYSSSPVASEPNRDGSIYQLVIARVMIPAGATAIAYANITDCRADQALCGYVSTVIDNPDFTAWYELNEKQFSEWFANIKTQLSGDVAGNLQNQIDMLTEKTGKIPTISVDGTTLVINTNGGN